MKTTISESQLNKIILEGIKKYISKINENKNTQIGIKGWNTGARQEIPLAPGNTKEKIAQGAEQAQINREAPTNLNQWDKLPLYGTPNSRLAFIQAALGIQADGKLGPQTLGTIFKTIGKAVTIGNVTMDPKYLQNVTWQPGKNGTITKITKV